VNYYERYCGDYARDTGHLSLQEHGAYTVMLDTYYATETPLPADYKALYRICRAMSGKEQEAVRAVADQFFPTGADGLRHNGKADEVIAKARKRIEAARANGAKNQPNGIPSGSPSGLADGSPSGHIGTTTRPHVPEETNSKTMSASADLKSKAVEILNFLNAKTGRHYKPVAANLEPIVARLKEFSCDDARAVVAKKCRDWKGDETMDKYLRPKTLFRRENFANYEGELLEVSNEQTI
jgi:uncharacterized phage protein (TIGR02220 family)